MGLHIKKCKRRFFKMVKVPPEIRQDFLRDSVRKNKLSLRISCGIIFVMEFWNILRVLFLSRSGLGTLNNRIYFSMYCALIALAVLWLVLERFLGNFSVQRQWIAQYVMTNLLLFWHMGLNMYDLYRDPAAGTAVLTTASLALALLIQMLPSYSLIQYSVSYVLFRIAIAPMLDSGDRLNLTITFVVAVAVSLTHAHQTCVALKQRKKIIEMNSKLQELVQLDSLTGLLNKTTVECRAEQLLNALDNAETSRGLTLFLVDLDEFKRINDQYGHPCGDHVLIETAVSIRNTFAGAAGQGRIGGDEFAILYDYPMEEKQAIALGQELENHLSGISWEEQSLSICCSTGICVCTKPQSSYRELYAKTDQMLYLAKRSGKGQCCFVWFKPEGKEKTEEK